MTFGCAEHVKQPAIVDVSVGTASDECFWRSGDRRFSREGDFLEWVREVRPKKVRISPAGDATYKCFGSTIIALQQRAIEVTFIEEPPPAQ